jgi:hypothetical protein
MSTEKATELMSAGIFSNVTQQDCQKEPLEKQVM